MIFEFKILSPGPNDRVDRYKRREIKDKIRLAVYDALWKAGMPRIENRCKIIYTVFSNKMRDNDNVAASAKVWIDQFKHYNLIKDDSPKYVDMEYKWEKGEAKTKIEYVEYLV